MSQEQVEVVREHIEAFRQGDPVRAAGPDHGRPRVGPLITQKRAPIGSEARCSSQRRSCSQPHSSIPTSRRFPPLP